mgnify:CR=1 FL=1
MLLGITGFNAAGKDTLAEFLERKGFVRKSLSDEIRKEVAVRNLTPTREVLIALGNELRTKEGNAVLAKRTLAGIDPSTNYTFSSIRNPAEVEELKKRKEFSLIFVDADIHKRFARSQKRKREGENQSLEQFKALEEKEYASTDSASQQLLRVREMADFLIQNDGNVEDFYKQVEGFLDKLNYVYRRPSWDEYFLEMSRTVAKRATCDRGRSGCVIVRDKRILTTGYVGSPPGMAHCDEVGHQMKKTVHEDGSESWHCVRTLHAEQNAILQASKLGISLEGATLYCRMTPCRVCAMLIMGTGIKRVVCERLYHAGQESEEMFKKAGIVFQTMEASVQKYLGQ